MTRAVTATLHGLQWWKAGSGYRVQGPLTDFTESVATEILMTAIKILKPGIMPTRPQLKVSLH